MSSDETHAKQSRQRLQQLAALVTRWLNLTERPDDAERSRFKEEPWNGLGALLIYGTRGESLSLVCGRDERLVVHMAPVPSTIDKAGQGFTWTTPFDARASIDETADAIVRRMGSTLRYYRTHVAIQYDAVRLEGARREARALAHLAGAEDSIERNAGGSFLFDVVGTNDAPTNFFGRVTLTSESADLEFHGVPHQSVRAFFASLASLGLLANPAPRVQVTDTIDRSPPAPSRPRRGPTP